MFEHDNHTYTEAVMRKPPATSPRSPGDVVRPETDKTPLRAPETPVCTVR